MECISSSAADPDFNDLGPTSSPEEISQSQKRVDKLEKAKQLACQILGTLNSLHTKLLHEVMHPGIAEDLCVEEIYQGIILLKERCRIQDTEPLRKRFRTQDPELPSSGETAVYFPQYNVEVVGTRAQVRSMLDDILVSCAGSGATSPIFLDIEGHNPGRFGTLSIVQVYVPPSGKVYLLDVHKLHDVAFNSVSTVNANIDFRAILQGSLLRKAFWDCRTYSDALFHHYGIRLDHTTVDDVQLLELGSTSIPKERAKVKSLSHAVMRLNLAKQDRETWLDINHKAGRIMDFGAIHIQWNADTEQFVGQDPAWETGAVWEQRPIPEALLEYACGDVLILSLLYEYLAGHEELTDTRRAAIQDETRRRIQTSQDPEYPRQWISVAKRAPEGWRDPSW